MALIPEFVSIGPGVVIARSVLVPDYARPVATMKGRQAVLGSALQPETLELDLFDDN